ncbi:MAG: EVE domain-containing protein [Gemmatimonadetes bacterium]|nr:EVE domain-containing protein [Gemmatimonadota bacterium]
MAKQYWLMKSEPDVYSIDDLKKDKRTMWNGVRSYQARNHMREMKKGDEVLFYHSRQSPPGVVGVARVVKEAYPDPTQFEKKSDYYDAKSSKDDPRWWLVDIGFVRKLAEEVPLPSIKKERRLKDMVLVNNSRLSVQPVTEAQFGRVVDMGGG